MASCVFVRSRPWVIALLGLLVVATITPTLSREPVESFARLPVIGDIAVSPTGDYLAIKQEYGGKYYLVVDKIRGNDRDRSYASKLGDYELRWMRWVTPSRLLVSIGFAARRYGVPTFETRLFAINYDGSNLKDMVKQRKGGRVVQIQDDVIDLLRNDPDHILMAYNENDPSRPRVYKVNIHTGRDSVVEGSQKGIYDWYTDQSGQVRIGKGIRNNMWETIVRDTNTDEWRMLRREYTLDRTVFGFFGFTKDPNILYVSSNHGGGPTALYEYDLRTDQFGKRIFGHPDVDVAGVTWHPRGDRLISVNYITEGFHRHWLDPSSEQDMKGVAEALPGLTISRIDSSRNGNTFVVKGHSVTDPGGYYYVRKSRGSVAGLGPNYPELEGVKLSPMHPFVYQASDGLDIPGYLTLPPNITDLDVAQNLPMVVMPHGGPTSRDLFRFDPFVQLLANRGYVVFQMNFRGSWGYGASFQAAGYGQWGQRMQDDISDGVRYLIDSGITDSNRICIFGISYGGYASLMGAVKSSDLYQCAVSLNGVSDLRRLIRAQFRYVGGRSELRTAHIGDYSGDRDMLREFSPKLRANEVNIPILIAAADDDRVVPANQSSSMASALRSAGKDYTFLELEDGGHSLTTSESRLTFMKALDGFLAQHLN